MCVIHKAYSPVSCENSKVVVRCLPDSLHGSLYHKQQQKNSGNYLRLQEDNQNEEKMFGSSIGRTYVCKFSSVTRERRWKMRKRGKDYIKGYIVGMLLFLALLLIPCRAEAAGGSCGDHASWNLDSNGTLTITGTGKINEGTSRWINLGNGTAVWQHNIMPWTDIRGQIKKLVIGDGITEIPTVAFDGCENMKEVSFSKTVSSVGELAFNGCGSLTAFSVDAQNPYFQSVQGVLFDKKGAKVIRYPSAKPGDTYTVPNGVVIMGFVSFQGCKNLKNVILPETLATLEEFCFAECKALEKVEMSSSVTDIRWYAFKACEKLTSITLPPNLTRLKEGTFIGCSALQSLAIPPTVTAIDAMAYGYDLDGNKIDTAVIRGITGSMAHAYAQENNLAFIHDPCVAGHSWDEGAVTVQATRKNPGKKAYTCSVCGTKKEETIPALGEEGGELLTVRDTKIMKLTKAGSKKIRVKLKKVSGASGYQIAWSTNKKFKKSVCKTSTKKTVCIIKKKIKKNKTYYVRARAWKVDSIGEKVYGAWSGKKKIKIR